MGVIIDSGIQAEIDQLEATGNLSLADDFRHASEISVAALSFMTNVPAQYQALVANTPAYQAAQKQRDEKAKEEEKQKEHAALVAYQQQIDSNMLHLTIDGTDVEISQGDLRDLMKKRVDALEKEKRELERSGSDPRELRRVNHLIDEYQPVIDDVDQHKADPSTMNAIQDLTKDDSEFASEIKARQATAPSPSNDATTQQSPTAPPSLKSTFVENAAPTISPQPDAVPSPVEQPQKTMKNTAAAVGF